MRWSVRHILLTYSVIILMVTAVLVGCVAYFTGRYSVEYLAQKSMSQQSQQLQEYTQSLLDTAIRPSRILTERLNSSPRRDQLDPLFPELRNLAHAYPELSYLSIGLEESGDYIHIHRFPDWHLEEAYYRYQSGGKSLRTDFRLEEARRVLLSRRITNYDPRQRSYYILAKKAGKPVWTPAYPFRAASGTPELGVTLSSPIHTASGELAGVVSADFTLANLTRYLKHLPLSANSTLCIIEEPKPGIFRILAHTNPALVGRPVQEDPTLTHAISAIPVDQLEQERRLTTIQKGGERFLVSGAMLHGPGYPHWRIYGLTPRADLMTPVYQSLWLGIGIALMGLFTTVWVSFRIARQITVPLHALTQQAESLGEQSLNHQEFPTKSESSLKEIGHLQDAIHRTHQRLQKPQNASMLVDAASPVTIAILAFESQSIGLYQQDIAKTLDGFVALIEQGGSVLQRGSFDLVAQWSGEGQIETAYHTLQACQSLVRSWSGTASSPLLIVLHHDEDMGHNPGEYARLLRQLTALNIIYGTPIIATETLTRHSDAQALLLTRPVEKVRLELGELLLTEEVLGLRHEAEETLLRVADLGNAFREHYLARDFVGAEQQARASLALRPNDPLMRRHLANALDHQRISPSNSWDGSRAL